ncbi:zinc protease [Vulcanibacillus modesticaldus]|uniref:Zinc protease n=1 Tax=Vulcanibacillus modesticaldus TaxID=337097 RepID=A0A1D2YXP8_9BACI|nr:pitrilysin family protein [Vulcanibacillus modesticaldus]OEG00450.1 zinc protease [Vulcanibacillus modesticaldus]
MIKKYTLDNGLRVILEDIPTVRSVAMGIWVKTGSRHENPHINGISHFIEHMFFKGTRTRTAREIAESFDSIGGNVNAFTSKEYTCYYAKVLDEHFNTGLEILSDMFFNSTIDEKELNRERNVVLEEIKMYEDTPDDQIHDLIAKVSFAENPLGYAILGTEKVLNSITRDTIFDYLSEKYIIENTVITIAGNLPENIIEIVNKHFGSFNNHGQDNQLEIASFKANETIKTKQTEQAHIALALPGLAVSDPDIYSLILLNNIIGGSMSSRLFQEVREKRGLAYSIFSYHSSFQDTGLFTIYAGTAPNQVDQVVDIIQNTLVNIKKYGIEEKEITKGKEQLKGSLMLSLESTNSRMNRLGKNELLLGRHLSLDETINRINQVNKNSIQGVINQVMNHQFSFAMISPIEELPKTLRRDILVSS